MNDPQPAPQESVSLRALFVGFLQVGLSGFGGVLPFARRMLVEERRWLTEREFTEVLSLGQFLPGPNIVNVCVIVGRRFQGPLGAIVAPLGLMLMPMVIVLVLAVLYAEVAQFEVVRGATRGVSAAASGLVIAVALRLAKPIRRSPWQLAIALTVFALIGLVRLPLVWVLAALLPVALAFAWWGKR